MEGAQEEAQAAKLVADAAVAAAKVLSAADMARAIQDRDTLVRIDQRVSDIHRAIYGNGRPGLIAEVAALKADMEMYKADVPSKLERRSALAGAVGVVAMLVGVVAKLVGLPVPG